MTKHLESCSCCGANHDGSIEIGLTIVGECDCAARAPTVPVFRAPHDHLPDCKLRKIGYAMIRSMGYNLGMRPEVTEL